MTNEFYKKLAVDDKTYAKYLPAFEAVKKLENKNRLLIIAIDGRCASGKSFLAKLFEKTFFCNVFHMDDFFLPFDMKTPERLQEPGGNVHYERFYEEVITSLQKHEAVTYKPYDCSKGILSEPIHKEFKNITVIEGSYSLHKELEKAYAYKIFLTINPKVQQERILKRNGEKMLQNFVSKWIPMEENYFSALDIEAKCDLVIDTSDL